MKPRIIALLLLSTVPLFADLREAKELMKQNQPGKAGEVLPPGARNSGNGARPVKACKRMAAF